MVRKITQGRAPEGAAHDASRHGPTMRAARIIGMLRPEIGGEDFSTCSDAGQGEPVIPLLPPRAAMQARPLPNHPLGDPEQAWREPSRVLLAIMADGWQAKDGPALLRQCDAAGLLDLYFSGAEWIVSTHPDPAVRAFGWRMAEAGEAVRRGDKDDEGRSIPIGRILGIQPAASTTAARALDRKVRDDLLRKARAAVPAWRDAPARQAALLMSASFDRYTAGPWLADQKREAAPAVEPAASWWRICSLGLKTKMPGCAHLASILEREN